MNDNVKAGYKVMVTSTGDGERLCFSISEKLWPFQSNNGFNFKYVDLEFLKGRGSSPGSIGSAGAPTSSVQVSMKNDQQEVDDFLSMNSQAGRVLIEDETHYRSLPSSLGPMSSIYSVEKASRRSVRLLTNKFNRDQVADAVRESQEIDDYLDRSSLSSSCQK